MYGLQAISWVSGEKQASSEARRQAGLSLAHWISSTAPPGLLASHHTSTLALEL